MNAHGNNSNLLYIYYFNSPPTNPNTKMANLMRRSSKDVVGRSKSDTLRCKKHPKHRQSPGVCSLCLREKLSQLSTSTSCSRSFTTTMESSCSSSSLSSYYSSSASSCSSPMHGYNFATHEGKSSLSTFLFGGKNVLTKSRSLVFVSRARGKDSDDHNKKKNGGFLSKLLRPRKSKKIEEDLVHSRTLREIIVTS